LILLWWIGGVILTFILIYCSIYMLLSKHFHTYEQPSYPHPMNLEIVIVSVVFFAIWPIVLVYKSGGTYPSGPQFTFITLGAISFGITLRYGAGAIWNKFWHFFAEDAFKYQKHRLETVTSEIQKVIDLSAAIVSVAYIAMLLLLLLSFISWRRGVYNSWKWEADKFLISPLFVSFALVVGSMLASSYDVWVRLAVTILPIGIYLVIVRICFRR